MRLGLIARADNTGLYSIRLMSYYKTMTMIGKKHSEETKKRMSEAAKLRIKKYPHTIPDNTGNKNFLGKTHSEEVRKRLSEAKMGSKNPMFGRTQEKSPNWKGDDVGYFGVHSWLYRMYGKATKCEICKCTDSSRYEWSNITGEYRRDIEDWQQLCKKCHNDYDGVNVWQQKRK